MDQILKSQKVFFNNNITRDVAFRLKQLVKLKNVLKQNEHMLYDAIYADFKKSQFDTFTNELALVYTDINEAVKKVKKWATVKRVRTNLVNFPAKSYIIPEPLGCCLVIGAWNYPYQLSLAPVIAAIAAGNTVVLKPSELPSRSSEALAKIINENFDTNYFTVVQGGIPETTELLEQKFDKIFFTGSVPVGKIVYQAAAKNLVPVTLELGGKSPAIVAKDCDLKMTVKRLVWAKFLNSGQSCIAPDYVMVERSIHDKFLEILINEIESQHFSVENDNYIQIINEKNMDRLAGMLDPEKIVFGGKCDKDTRIFEPTVMRDVTFDDAVMQDEIFGPILPVLSYDSLDDTIAKIKSRPKPLACYVFTNDKKIRNKVLDEISFGGGAVNEAVMHISNNHLPFGGVGNSGIGAYHSEAGFRAFSHYKSILEKPTWFELNLKYFPHSFKKLSVIKLMMGIK